MKNEPNRDNFHALQCDISCEENVVKVFEWIAKNFTTPHILVNNAGIIQTGRVEGIGIFSFIYKLH